MHLSNYHRRHRLHLLRQRVRGLHFLSNNTKRSAYNNVVPGNIVIKSVRTELQNSVDKQATTSPSIGHIGNLKHVAEAQMIALNMNLETWPTTPLIFTPGVKKCKVWPLRRCGFETKQRIAYLFQVS